MELSILRDLNEAARQRYRHQRDREFYHRVVDGDYEPVKYLPGSSLRIWFNEETNDWSNHWHPAIEIIVPLENIYTARTQQREYILNPGDILIIPPGDLHTLITPPTGSRLIYLFDSTVLSKLNGFSYLMPFLSQPVLITADNSAQIYQEEVDLLEKMFVEYFSNTNLYELLIYSHLLRFFATWGRFRMQQDDTLISSNSVRQQELIDKLHTVFDYLDQHYTEEITLEKVADVAGFSKFHFSRLFKQCSGQNFYDYLCFKRIKSAEMLLLKPELSITEIALQSGFSSLSTFNRTFRRTKNCTPSEYRSLCSKNTPSA